VKTLRAVLIVLAAAGGLTSAARADVIQLADLNSVAAFDPAAAAIHADWYVDGHDYLVEQGFWYRIGEAGAELPLAALGLVSAVPQDTSGDGLFDKLTVKYGSADLQVDVIFALFGGDPGSGWSALVPVVTARNAGAAPLSLHFFQYADFDLADAGDTVEITGGNTARQTAGPILVAESVDTPMPDYYRAALAPEIRALLDDALPTVLGTVTGPVTGDATWAMQWHADIGPGGTWILSKPQHLETPEPTTLAFLALGAAGAGLRRFRKR